MYIGDFLEFQLVLTTYILTTYYTLRYIIVPGQMVPPKLRSKSVSSPVYRSLANSQYTANSKFTILGIINF